MKWYWPELTNQAEAEQAAHQGAGICFFVAAVTSIIAAASVWLGKPILGMDGWSFADAAFFGIAGWRIWRLSRTWAVLALVMYLVERVYMLLSNPAPAGLVIGIVFTLALISSVRGTFLFHRLKREESASMTAVAGQS